MSFNVTMTIERNDGAIVYIQDSGHYYTVPELDRILRTLKLARDWKARQESEKASKK